MNAYTYPGITTTHLPLGELALSIAEQLGVDITLLQRDTRSREVVSRRQIAMYLMRRKGFTFCQIGGFFKKNHATVIHSVRTIDREMEYDKQLRAMIGAMKPLLKTGM